MFGLFDIIPTLAGMIIPPIADIFKQKILKNQNPINALISMASTNPTGAASFVESTSKLLSALTGWSNRDVSGNISPWVSNLRASIRPIFIVGYLVLVFVCTILKISIEPSIACLGDVAVGSWFGDRFKSGMF